MAYQSTFTANLQPLEQAITKATPTLNNFEQRSKQVGSSLQRMVSEFDGTKVVQQATLLVGAIDKIGGASRLTEAEQRRVNSTLDEAISKYRALGQVAPQAMTDLFNQTKRLGGVSEVLGRVGTLAAGVFAGFTLDRVVNEIGRFVAKTIEAGGQVNDLAAKLGVSTTAVQRWDFAAKQNGNTVEQLGAAVTQMSIRLAGGNASAVSALEKLNLNVGALRASAPEQAFETIAAAIARVPDPMAQAALGAAVMGKSFADILPTIKADLVALGDEAERLGLVLSDETIAAMDDLGDSIDKLQLAGSGLLAQVFAPMVPLLNDVAQGMLDIAKTAGPQLSGFFTDLKRRYFEGVIAQAEFTKQVVALEAKIPIFGKFTNAASDLKKLDDTIVGAKLSLLAMGTSVETAGKKTDSARKPVFDFGRATGDAARDAKKLQDATDAFFGRDLVARANALVDIYVANGRQLPPTIALQKRLNDELAAAAAVTSDVSTAFTELLIRTLPAVETFQRGLPDGLLQTTRAADELTKPLGLMIDQLRELERKEIKVGLPSGLLGPNTLDTSGLPAPPPRVGDRFANVFGAQFGEQLGSAIVQAFAGGGSVGDTVAALVGQKLGQRIGEEVSESLAKSLGDKGAGLVGGVVGAFAGQAIGGLISFGLDKLLKTEGRKVNDLRDQFVGAAGGLGALNEQAARAGVTLDRLLKANTVKAYQAAVADLEQAFARLEARVTTTVGSIGKVSASGGFLSADLGREVLALRNRPEVREALGAFLEGQADRTVGGLEAFLKNSQISSLPTATSLEGAIVAQFGALTQAGASPLEAIQRLTPAIEAFGARTSEVVGFQASPAFESLQRIVALTTDGIAGPALAAVGGLGNVLVGLQNQGLLTQEVFGGLARQTFDTFRGLELVGRGGVDAARAMQQPLQRTWELVKDFGFSVDEDTKKLLDFAESSGLIGEKFRPAEDRFAAGVDRLIGKIEELVDTLTGSLVNSAYASAGQVERAFDGIRPRPIRLDVELGDVPEIPGFKGGTQGLVDFGRGTLAVLHGREAVFTEAQLSALAATSGAGTQVAVYIGEERFASTLLRGTRNVLRLQ